MTWCPEARVDLEWHMWMCWMMFMSEPRRLRAHHVDSIIDNDNEDEDG